MPKFREESIIVVDEAGDLVGTIYPDKKDADKAIFEDAEGNELEIYAVGNTRDGCPEGTCMVGRWCLPC